MIHVCDPYFDEAVLPPPDYLMYVRSKMKSRILSESFGSATAGMSVFRNDKILHLLDEIILRFHEGGLIDYEWYKKVQNDDEFLVAQSVREFGHFSCEPPLDGPKVLTMGELEAGFVVWVC